MNDDDQQAPDDAIITGEMSEDAIMEAAVANDSAFTARLEELYGYFVDIGKRAMVTTAFIEAQSAFGNAMTIANSMHKIAVMREQLVRQRLDRHPARTDLELDSEDTPFGPPPDDDAVDDL